MPTTKLPGDLIIADVNTLAGNLFLMHGQSFSQGFMFHSATCELGIQCWNAAVVIYFNTVLPNSGVSIEDFMIYEATRPRCKVGSAKQPVVYN